MNRREALGKLAAAGVLTLAPSSLIAAATERFEATAPLPANKFVIGHRGACAYAPENTLESYQLAIKQGVDYVEQDLQISKDGVLVCAHDTSLERVTNVQEIFPARFKEQTAKGRAVKRWMIHDFTLKELKQLDFGARFDPKFKGVKIPTWEEAIDLIKGKSGLCPETKAPEYYGKLGFNMERLVVAMLKKTGMEKAKPGSSTPVFIQSFSASSLKRLVKDHGIKWPTLWLGFAAAPFTPTQLQEAAGFASAIGPSKEAVTAELVAEAHALGLKVVAYTFRPKDVKDFKDVSAEMSHFLYELGIDGLFTDNPDRFPRKKI
jgi:glycerophosphoryl diester phosphodiesterase